MRSGFKSHIEKRRRQGWFCVTREVSAREDARSYFGPFRLKRDAKLMKTTAKKSYAEQRRAG